MVIRSAATVLGLFGVATLGLGTGCNFSTFDELGDEAWAQSIGSPSTLPSDNFGIGVGIIAGAPDAAWVAAVGGNPDGVAYLKINDAGGVDSSGDTLQIGASVLPLAVPTPIASDGVSASGAIAIGAADDAGGGNTIGRVAVYNQEGLHSNNDLGRGPVHAVAFGPVNNPDDAGATDLVVSAGNELFVRGNYGADTATERTLESCDLARDRGYAIAIADLHSGNAESEILIAMGNANQDGTGSSVMVIDAATVAAAKADLQDQSCVLDGVRLLLHDFVAPNAEPDFGNSIVVADFDGGNGLDVAIGAPSTNKVYVYMNVDLASAVPGPPIEINGPTGSVKFGTTLATGDFNNDGADELVVGDPQASPDGITNAGLAYLIPADGDFATQHVLGDADPQRNQSFGRSLAVGSFGGGTGSILVVGAHKEVFVYFRTHVSDDVRN